MSKTLDEKVEQLFTEIWLCNLRIGFGADKAKEKIRLALKEQDRDTRHSCAEAILTVRPRYDVEDEWGDDFSAVTLSQAKSVIMNCRGGLK